MYKTAVICSGFFNKHKI